MKYKFIKISALFFILIFFSIGLLINYYSDQEKISESESQLPLVNFDENNIVIKFGVISDIHTKGFDEEPSQRLTSVISQLNHKANCKLDVVFVIGDLTEYGYPEQVKELKRVIDKSKIDPAKTKFIFAIGNHDYYNHWNKGAEWNGGYLFKRVFGDEIYFGAADKEIIAGNHHAVVKGYDFIAVNCTQYKGGIKYLQSDINWLKKELQESSSKHPGHPIFVGSHPQIEGTNFGSNGGDKWACKDLYYILKDYPQVIYFGGHIHFPENDERSIWQGNFTSIAVASTYYLANYFIDDGNKNKFIDIDESGFKTFDAHSTSSQGLYIEVDKKHNVKITRLDFTNEEVIKNPWIIPSPKRDNSHLFYYTPDNEAKIFSGTAPIFPAGAFIKEISCAGGKYIFQFTQAIDDDMVYSYRISFVEKSTQKIIKTISTLSDFYLFPNPSEMSSSLIKCINNADSVLAPLYLQHNNDYYLKITALDCFGQESKPIFSE